MKKIFALLLALALLIPMGLVPVASAESEVTVEPFYALSWSDVNEEKYPYIDGFVRSNFSKSNGKAKISYGGAVVTYGSYTDADVTKFAEAMKKTMDARPAGMRYWLPFGPKNIMEIDAQSVIYLDTGVDQMKALMTDILKKYKEIGGVLDGVVIDTEYVGLTSYYLSKDAAKDPLLYKKIVDDPHYATEVRPLLEERGFLFYPDVTDHTPEIYSADEKSGDKYAESRAIWNTVMNIRLGQYANEWCYEPLKEYFPEASLSDYKYADNFPWKKLTAVTDDGVALTGGNTYKVGNVSTYSFYYGTPSTSFYEGLNKYAAFNDAVYEHSAFNSLLYYANFVKNMYENSDTKKVAPWITSYFYGSNPNKLGMSPYYTEFLYHIGLLDPEPFLSYTANTEYNAERWALTMQIMNDIMAELTRVAGYSDRKAIEVRQEWNTEFILSGMYANGRNIWRITPNSDEVSLEDFKVEGTDPTFTVKGVTVTFPGGKIIEDTAIANAGSCGYWVETAANVNPIVKNDADRYQKYPSLSIDFEAANEGKFDMNTCTPFGAWEFSLGKGAGVNVQTVNGNKVLAINGAAEVRSVKVPGNITAGDTYAEDQVWEITATIPEGLPAEAEIVLLNYAGKKQPVADGGFKIAGGKLYYSYSGEYLELMDISAGTYTFKRVMDFNNKELFSGSYHVYDAAGNELKSTEKVPLPAFTSISSIKFSSKNTDKTLLLDNYKIYLTGTTIDISLYDAKTGMNAEPDAIRNSSTAYRVAWLNASDKEQTVSIMAAIYEGDTLKEEKVVQELKMAPGYDHVETGIVEIAEGQSVKVYVKSDVKVTLLPEADGTPATPPAAPTVPTTAPTAPTGGSDAGDKGGQIGSGLIAVIAVAVIGVIAVVVALMATKPAKKADAPEAEEKAEEAQKEEPEAPTEE